MLSRNEWVHFKPTKENIHHLIAGFACFESITNAIVETSLHCLNSTKKTWRHGQMVAIPSAAKVPFLSVPI